MATLDISIFLFLSASNTDYVVSVSAQTLDQTPNFGNIVNITVAPINNLCAKGIVVDAVTSVELGKFLDSQQQSFTPWNLKSWLVHNDISLCCFIWVIK